MKTYIITYDLRPYNDNIDYMPLYDAIREINNDTPWQHFMESAWLVRTELTSQEIFEKLFPHLGGDNGNLIFITEINEDNKSGWVGKPTWEWLKNYEESE